MLRCGICGSDLHARHHCDELADVLSETGYDGFMRSDQRVVFGHEFCGEVADYGPGCRKASPTGLTRRRAAAPAARRRAARDRPVRPPRPGAYAEQVVVEESLMLPVPNGAGARPRAR